MSIFGKVGTALMHWMITPWLLPTRSLTGRWLRVAQVLAGFVALSSTLMFVFVLPVRYAWLNRLAAAAVPLLQVNSNLNPRFATFYTEIFPQTALAIEAAVMLLYVLNAALLFWKRSHDWVALLTAAALPSFALHITPTMFTWMEQGPAETLVGSIFKCLGLGLAFLFLFLFPNGNYAPHWMRLFFIGWIFWAVIWLASPRSVFGFRDPYTIDIPGFFLLTAWWMVGILSQIYRYTRVSSALERQQTKIITFGATLTFIGYALYVPARYAVRFTENPVTAGIVFKMVAPYIYLTMIATIPILITLSILRYRLWDIDLIIRRTLVYSLLSGLLTLLYFGGVALTQLLVTIDFWPLAPSRGQPSTFIIVLTTLLMAALFNPLRRKIQSFIDQRFYRRKYNAEQALAEFAEMARSETDLQELSVKLIAVVQETVEPEFAGLWYIRKRENTVKDES